MRKRTRKLLSIVLASAMVLSMHSMAFAAEETTQNEVTYADGVAVIKNATDPLSWNSAQSAQFDAILNHVEDDHLANGKKIDVSADAVGRVSYNVISLEGAEGSYLFFAYGTRSALINVDGEGRMPAATYDGRKKAFKGDSAAKDAAFEAHLALVKYDSSAKTVTKVDGVELSDLKMDKNNLHASVSGDATVPIKKGDTVVDTAHAKLDGKSTPTFTIKAKISGKNIDKTVKKAAQTALKNAKYPYAILPKRVNIGGSWVMGTTDGVSENSVGYGSYIESNIEASKLNTKSAKATLSYEVEYTTKKGEEKIATKKINPKDYSLKSETVADSTILILDEFKSTDYEYSSTDLYASQGYKLCFREKGEKKNKYVAYGIYKSASDVFVTSVE